MLSFFNREYRVRRLAAHAAGRSFLPYAEAHRRLRRALASAAATGSMPELLRPGEHLTAGADEKTAPVPDAAKIVEEGAW